MNRAYRIAEEKKWHGFPFRWSHDSSAAAMAAVATGSERLKTNPICLLHWKCFCVPQIGNCIAFHTENYNFFSHLMLIWMGRSWLDPDINRHLELAPHDLDFDILFRCLCRTAHFLPLHTQNLSLLWTVFSTHSVACKVRRVFIEAIFSTHKHTCTTTNQPNPLYVCHCTSQQIAFDACFLFRWANARKKKNEKGRSRVIARNKFPCGFMHCIHSDESSGISWLDHLK